MSSEDEVESNQKALKFKHWSVTDDLRYYFYLLLNEDEVGSEDKATEKYRLMSIELVTFSNNQCRTHHQKKLKKAYCDLQILKLQFFKEFYIDRLLGEDHLEKEISLFIEKSPESKQIQYLAKWFEIKTSLKFENVVSLLKDAEISQKQQSKPKQKKERVIKRKTNNAQRDKKKTKMIKKNKKKREPSKQEKGIVKLEQEDIVQDD